MKTIRRRRKSKKNFNPEKESKIRQNTRRKFLHAAKKLMAEYGYQGATIRAICQEAGYSNGALYNYFDNKEHLFREVFQSSGRELVEEIRKTHKNEPLSQLKTIKNIILKHKQFMLLFDVDACIKGRETQLFLTKFKNCIYTHAPKLNATRTTTCLQLAAALLRSPVEGIQSWLSTIFNEQLLQQSLLAA